MRASIGPAGRQQGKSSQASHRRDVKQEPAGRSVCRPRTILDKAPEAARLTGDTLKTVDAALHAGHTAGDSTLELG